MRISTYQEAIDYLYQYIPNGMKYRFPGDVGLTRTKLLLEKLGSPQNKLRIIHIAGTSGKGSTVYFISILLKAAGFKVGLETSPHFIDLRERCQINNELISENKFCQYLNDIIPAIEEMKNYPYGQPTFFEVTVALAYYIFYQEKVDYAIVETGLGGLYDGTNVVSRTDKIAVITRLGFDHMEILGHTLGEIAAQKAGIIGSGNALITLKNVPAAQSVVEKKARASESEFHVISHQNYKITSIDPLTFDFGFGGDKFREIKLHMSGEYQVENCSIALAVCLFLARRDKFILSENLIKKELLKASFPGRMQILHIKGKTVVIDGAHNPQKMAAFTKSLRDLYPKKKFLILLAFKKGKDYKNILRYLLPFASQIVITSFFSKDQGVNWLSEKPEVVGKKLEYLNFKNYAIIKSVKEAVVHVLKSKENVVITGSLYLLSEVYPLLY